MTIQNNDARFDAQDTMFFEAELKSVQEEVDVKYPVANYGQVTPIDMSDPAGSETVGYRMFDHVGISKIMADGVKDSPSVDVFGTEHVVKVHEVGNHYSYTQKEIRRSRIVGRSLDSDRARASAMADEKAHDEIAIAADGTEEFYGLTGIVYNSNVSKVAATAGATTGNTVWGGASSKNADEIVKDVTDQYLKIISDTNGTSEATKIALSRYHLSILETTKYGVDNHASVKDYLETSLNVQFVTHQRLFGMAKNPATLAAGTFNVMIVYWGDPINVKYKMPMPYTTYPAKNEGRSFKIETGSESAGVQVKYPLSVVVFYGF